MGAGTVFCKASPERKKGVCYAEKTGPPDFFAHEMIQRYTMPTLGGRDTGSVRGRKEYNCERRLKWFIIMHNVRLGIYTDRGRFMLCI